MTYADKKRLNNHIFQIDIDGLRRGIYSDKYFHNSVDVLEKLADEQYRFSGKSPRPIFVDQKFDVGNAIVEAQIFTRRSPYAIVGGVDISLSVLRHCTGYFQDNEFVSTWSDLEVAALYDGDRVEYDGDVVTVKPVIRIRGRYRDFALFETPILGYLTRISRITTNVFDVMKVSNGKPVLFFPARFDLPEVQAADGYAYWLAIQRYNHEYDKETTAFVSTDAQGMWWGGGGGGTVPHAYIATFLADSAEAMVAYARKMPADESRILLADFNNDCVNSSLETLDAYWPHYREAYLANDEEGMRRWTLFAVRLDTSGNMIDESLSIDSDRGVSASLVNVVRRAMNNHWQSWNEQGELENVAKTYCENVKIAVTGGFNQERIADFEKNDVPVDIYGVGSNFLNNSKSTKTDFTMDVVRIQVDNKWLPIAKVGRLSGDNDALVSVDLSQF